MCWVYPGIPIDDQQEKILGRTSMRNWQIGWIHETPNRINNNNRRPMPTTLSHNFRTLRIKSRSCELQRGKKTNSNETRQKKKKALYKRIGDEIKILHVHRNTVSYMNKLTKGCRKDVSGVGEHMKCSEICLKTWKNTAIYLTSLLEHLSRNDSQCIEH